MSRISIESIRTVNNATLAVYSLDNKRCATFVSGQLRSTPAVLAQLREELIKSEGIDLRRCEDIDDSGLVRLERPRVGRAWLALVTGLCSQYGLEREFVGARGQTTFAVEDLEDGIYEASSAWSSRRTHRTFFELRGSEIFTLYREDVMKAFALAA